LKATEILCSAWLNGPAFCFKVRSTGLCKQIARAPILQGRCSHTSLSEKVIRGPTPVLCLRHQRTN
jgi:hypothetical protein